MIQLPNFVFEYLIQNNYFGKTRTLIVGENYPNPNYADTYFYRSVPLCPGGPGVGAQPQFFQRLCDCLLIPHIDLLGAPLTEFQRLKYFLNNGFILIDAQPNGIPPNRVPPILEANQINNLVNTILLLNPENIIFLTNNNLHVIDQIGEHTLGNRIISNIVTNPISETQVFSFPAPPANPNLFIEQINALRATGFKI
ncbi:MAG: hypothetical protein IT280_02275 [Ignavibacteria bacterium]|nr:hypothetical protein [Ignavibacteria bacterium]